VTTRAPATAGNSQYAAFLSQLDEEPTAEELEDWARRHPQDPDAERALLDAAHQHAFDGDHERALELFSEVRGRGGDQAHAAHAGTVEELLALGRSTEADEQLAALRRTLDAAAEPDPDVYADVAVMLDEQRRGEDAIAWCEAGLARSRQPADAGEKGVLPSARARMLILRSELRREKGLKPDGLDEQAEEEDERGRQTARQLFEALAEAVPGQRGLLPDDGAVYNAVILHWPQQEFTAVRARWPEATELYGEDYAHYCTLLQREAQGYSDAGAARTVIVRGTLDDYEAYARRTGKDPAERQTRRNYGEWCAANHPERALAWPPPRNGPCWCGSDRKYKKCCGSPSRT
jgi:tetratricopeptide (TPR) repeat protein